MQVKDLTVEQLENLIKTCVEQALNIQEEDDFLTLNEASKFAKRSRQTIKLWEKNGLIKSTKISERISYYSKKELKKLLQGVLA